MDMDDVYILVDGCRSSGRAAIVPLGGESFDGDWPARYPHLAGAECPQAFRCYESTDNGIRYHWELAGPSGASFLLFPTPRDTPADVAAAKAQLRHSQDVVRLRVFRITYIERGPHAALISDAAEDE